MRVTQKMHVADMNPKVLAAPTEKEQMPIVYTTQKTDGLHQCCKHIM